MFHNLIESDSHRKEFKRRTSFFLATVVAYSLALFAAAIVGIYTYDARVEAQANDLLGDYWVPPVKPPATINRSQPPRRTPSSNKRVSQPTRPILYESASNPLKPPDTISAAPNSIPPAPSNAIEAPYVSDPPPTPTSGCENCNGNDTHAPPVVDNHTPPPVVIPDKPPTQRVSAGVLMAKVVDLPKPGYPIIAKQMRTQGSVNVQVLIDESGKVISAHAVNGNPVFVNAAEDAARRARFTPTKLGDQSVKVQGVITYNFVLQ